MKKTKTEFQKHKSTMRKLGNKLQAEAAERAKKDKRGNKDE